MKDVVRSRNERSWGEGKKDVLKIDGGGGLSKVPCLKFWTLISKGENKESEKKRKACVKKQTSDGYYCDSSTSCTKVETEMEDCMWKVGVVKKYVRIEEECDKACKNSDCDKMKEEKNSGSKATKILDACKKMCVKMVKDYLEDM